MDKGIKNDRLARWDSTRIALDDGTSEIGGIGTDVICCCRSSKPLRNKLRDVFDGLMVAWKIKRCVMMRTK